MKYAPSMKDYTETADELRQLQSKLIDIDIRVTNTFGKKYDLRKTHETVAKMRSLLEDKMFEDFPTNASIYVFYPHKKVETEP